jgi:K+-sensing histidine kinase KdpD
MTKEGIDREALLKSFQEGKQSKGQLKIFLGMAAGVGKTYAMLEAAQSKMREGIHLIVASVDTHGRPETAKLLEGLPLIPEKKMVYRGKEFKELDLDRVLQIKPELVVIDELAHSNIPGSRNEKRWQDVIEVLDEGIAVYTTCNIQHIESYKDVIERIAEITIRETVPDLIFERATDVELIDLTPQELLQRLKEGKVYTGDLSAIAARNFFQEDRITALREIALRLTAEIVDKELHEIYLALQQRKGWQTRERLLVAVNHKLYSQYLIRTVRRRAYALHAPWIALFVDEEKKLTQEEAALLSKNLALARNLGAEIIATRNRDLAAAILQTAQQREATQIIVGKRQQKSWTQIFKGSLFRRLLKESEYADILLVREPRLFIRAKKKGKKVGYAKPFLKGEQSAQAIYEIVREIAGAPSTAHVFKAFKEKVGALLNGKLEIAVREDGLLIEEQLPLLEGEKERAVANWVLENGKEAGWSTSTLSSAKNLYIPLKGFKTVVGVLAYRPLQDQPLHFEEMNFLYTVAQQLANYLERSLAEERERENRNLQEIEKIYAKVLSTISHELYQPLKTIHDVTHELKKEGAFADTQLRSIENSTETLIRVLENASAMATLSGRLIGFQKIAQDIHALIQACCKKFEPLLKQHRLILKMAEDLPEIAFDFSLMEILLSNLLLNAIQYSPPKTIIELQVETIDTNFILSVLDQGPGIPEEMIDRIFEKFYRVPGTTSTGLGLGLPIASAIAKVHKGEIRVQNLPKGGAKFSLILPLTAF